MQLVEAEHKIIYREKSSFTGETESRVWLLEHVTSSAPPASDSGPPYPDWTAFALGEHSFTSQ